MHLRLKTLRSIIRETLYQASAPKRLNLEPIEIDAKNTEVAGDEASKRWFNEKGVRVDPMTIDLQSATEKHDIKLNSYESYHNLPHNHPIHTAFRAASKSFSGVPWAHIFVAWGEFGPSADKVAFLHAYDEPFQLAVVEVLYSNTDVISLKVNFSEAIRWLKNQLPRNDPEEFEKMIDFLAFRRAQMA